MLGSRIKIGFFAVAMISLSLHAESPVKVNKLEQMFRFYYLPFSLDFKEGRTANEIFPFGPDKYRDYTRLIKPEELQKLDTEWGSFREEWKKRSLFLSTPVGLNETVHLSQRLISHRIPLNRSAWHGLSLNERIQLENILKTKPESVQTAVTQLRLLKSFLSGNEEEKFNFFIVGPHWCESSREYRALLEAYFKNFPNSELILHSVVVEDPKEEIFDAKMLKEMFPYPEKYTQDIVPKFIAIQTVNGKTTIWEEGEALKELYERFYKPHRGYLDLKIGVATELFQPLLKAEAATTKAALPLK